jgi:peptidyl-prolyl cis-trans isomerase D
MLDNLRKYATGWVAQLFIGLLVLSFAVWGVSDIFTGFRSDAVAQVGSTDVTVVDFQRDYDLAIQNLSRQLGAPITQQQATQMGIPGQVLGRLVSQATLNEAAGNLGLGMSNAVLGRQIAEDPRFHGPDGTFNRGYLSEYIRSQNMTEDQFIDYLRNEYLRGQIGQAFAGGVSAPESYLRAVHDFRTEQRDISYVILHAPTEAEVPNPDETALSTWFTANAADFAAPEYRAVTYFSLSPDEIARADEITDEEARERYDANPQRFTTVERRRVQQIVFPDRAEADAAAEALAGGQTFDALLTERGLTPEDVDLGLVPKDQLVDPAIAEAAFALAPNTVSAVVDGAFGPVLLRVTEIEPAVVTSFEEAKDSLKAEIAAERAVAEINDTYNAIEDARAGGDSISEAAARYGLEVVSVPAIDASGNGEDGQPVAGIPQQLLTAIFDTEVGFENDPVEPERNSFTWYEVTAVTDPRDRTLDEVRDRAVTAWKAEQRQVLLDERTKAVLTELETRPLADVASELRLQTRTAADLTRVAQPSGEVTQGAISAIFSTAEGEAGSAPGSAPLTGMVFVVDDITVPEYAPDGEALTQAKEQFDTQFVGDLLGMYVGELQNKTSVRFNQALLEQIMGVAPN